MLNTEETADKVGAKQGRRIFYCTSCDLISMSNPAVNIQGIIDHLEIDHLKFENSYWPSLTKLFRSYNCFHQGSTVLSFIAAIRYKNGKMCHSRLFKNSSKDIARVTKENIGEFFSSALNEKIGRKYSIH